jgi:polysaccharide export outer membrane protein
VEFPLKAKLTILFLLTYIINTGFSLLNAAPESKKIKVGDVVEIMVYGQEALTRVVKVTQEGTINFPFLENIPVDGLTLDELRDIITVQLSKYSLDKKPIVTLNFLNSYLIYVTILGQVQKPGSYRISQNSSIQGAISEAGGPIPGAKLAKVQLIRAKDSNQPTTMMVDFEKFLIEEDVFTLPELEDGDLIFVPGWPGANSVKVLGEVKDPGNYEVFANLQNVLDVIFKAGGTTDKADLSKVQLISPDSADAPEKFIDIEQLVLNREKSSLPVVMPGDIIYVPKKNEFWKSMIQMLRDVTSVATLYIIIRYGKRI